jgi:hypothetical protein
MSVIIITEDQLFLSDNRMALDVFSCRMAINCLKLSHNPDSTELPAHGALRIAVR